MWSKVKAAPENYRSVSAFPHGLTKSIFHFQFVISHFSLVACGWRDIMASKIHTPKLNETPIWLRIIERSRLLGPQLVANIKQENRDLCKIFTSSLKTA